MASPIPTFTSNRMTQIPSMGIVSMSGDNAMAQAMGNVGIVFDKVADYQNKKLDEKMQRETTKAAQDAVRNSGLNPKDLDDPYTVADQIYREAALNTYSIQVESDIDNTLNQFVLESKYNATGYTKKATAYLEGTMAELAPEMKDGVRKYTLSKINSTGASIARETQSKALAEASAAAANYQEKLAADIVNASPEERDAIYAKVQASVLSDPSNITAQGKQAALDDLQRKIITQTGLKDGMTGDKSIPEIVTMYEQAGIMITPSLKQQIYSSTMVEYNYQQQLYNRQQAQKQKVIENQQDAFYDQLLQNQGASDIEILDLVSKTQEAMRASGAGGEEIMKFKSTAMNTYYGSQVESRDVKAFIEDGIARGNVDVEGDIKKSVREGLILPRTGMDYLRQAEVATNDVVKTPAVQKYIATNLRELYPNATPFSGLRPSDAATPEMVRKIESDTLAYNAALSEIANKVNNSEKPMSVEDVISQRKGVGLQEIESNNTSIEKVPDTPVRNEVYSLINNKEPSVVLYNNSASDINKIQKVRYADIDKLNPNNPIEKTQIDMLQKWGEGSFSKDNARARLRVINKINAEYIKHNPNGNQLPYPIEVRNTIMGTFDLTIEDLQ